jgi:hypothetical protein
LKPILTVTLKVIGGRFIVIFEKMNLREKDQEEGKNAETFYRICLAKTSLVLSVFSRISKKKSREVLLK